MAPFYFAFSIYLYLFSSTFVQSPSFFHTECTQRTVYYGQALGNSGFSLIAWKNKNKIKINTRQWILSKQRVHDIWLQAIPIDVEHFNIVKLCEPSTMRIAFRAVVWSGWSLSHSWSYRQLEKGGDALDLSAFSFARHQTFISFMISLKRIEWWNVWMKTHGMQKGGRIKG